MKYYYEILGVPPNASTKEIKAAYHKKALKFHPDKHAGEERAKIIAAQETFKEINEAYKTLSKPKEKEQYDEILKSETATQKEGQAKQKKQAKKAQRKQEPEDKKQKEEEALRKQQEDRNKAYEAARQRRKELEEAVRKQQEKRKIEVEEALKKQEAESKLRLEEALRKQEEDRRRKVEQTYKPRTTSGPAAAQPGTSTQQTTNMAQNLRNRVLEARNNAALQQQNDINALLQALDTSTLLAKPIANQNQEYDTSTTKKILQERNAGCLKETTSFKYNEETQTGLSAEEIRKIKEIFKEQPELIKLPRSLLIEKKIKNIQEILNKPPSTLDENQKNLLNDMLKRYNFIQKLLKKHDLNLKYSIINSNPDQNNPVLNIVYPVTLGPSRLGKVKLAQNLTTKKISEAKIHNYNRPTKQVDDEEKILIGLSAPAIKSKNYLFSNYIEGVTLSDFLMNVETTPSKMLDGLLKGLEALKDMSNAKMVHTNGTFLDLENNGDIDNFGNEIKKYASLFNEPLKSNVLTIADKMTTTDPKKRITIDKCIALFQILRDEEENQKHNNKYM